MDGKASQLIPLCVPYGGRGQAKAAGARWNPEQRQWECEPELLSGPSYPRLRPFVPRMHRPDLAGPAIRPWLVPSPLWGKNLRALLLPQQWDEVRRAAYGRAGYRCIVCGGRGPEWPVEADEAWSYDDERLIHKLVGVVALCPDCHAVRHWGHSELHGKGEAAFAKLMAVNRWTEDQAGAAVDEAFEVWSRRSEQTWTSDYGWVAREHGFEISAEGYARAEAANREYATTGEAEPQSAVAAPAQPPPPRNPITDLLRSLFRRSR